MAPQKSLPYGDFQETVIRRGIKVTIWVESVLQASMPSGYSARGKYQISTDYCSATDASVELSLEQGQYGRALATQRLERLEKLMKRAGWSEAISLSGEKTLLANNGSKIWGYFGPPPPLTNDQQLVGRRMKKRAITFTCSVCGETVTQQRFPSHLPKYCSDACRDLATRSDETREKTRLRVAAWRKAHPDARRKRDVTSS